MTQKKKQVRTFCPYALKLENPTLQGAIRYLRGKRRNTVKIAAARAMAIAMEHIEEMGKDPRLPQVDKILSAHKRKIASLEKDTQNKLSTLFPEIKEVSTRVGFRESSNYHAALCAERINSLRESLLTLCNNLHREEREEGMQKLQKNPCGVEVPSTTTLKNISKDPKLKAALDAFTASIAKED